MKETLAESHGASHPHFALLLRIQTGKELANIVCNAHAYLLDNDELETEEEMRQVASFLQNAQDWGGIWSDLERSQIVETIFQMTKEIREIEAAGFWVFGTTEQRKLRARTTVIDCPTAVVTLVRPTNKGITELGDLASLIKN